MYIFGFLVLSKKSWRVSGDASQSVIEVILWRLNEGLRLQLQTVQTLNS